MESLSEVYTRGWRILINHEGGGIRITYIHTICRYTGIIWMFELLFRFDDWYSETKVGKFMDKGNNTVHHICTPEEMATKRKAGDPPEKIPLISDAIEAVGKAIKWSYRKAFTMRVRVMTEERAQLQVDFWKGECHKCGGTQCSLCWKTGAHTLVLELWEAYIAQ